MATVCLLSGGMDSLVAAAWALKHLAPPFTALSFRYNSLHNARELQCARHLARELGMEHIVASIHLPVSSALVDESQGIERLQARERTRGLPSSFVPGRNIVFLSLAAGVAYSRSAQHIVIGAHPGDNVGYPDCRLEFMQAMEQTLKIGLGNYPIRIHAPLHQLADVSPDGNGRILAEEVKAKIVVAAMELGVGNLLRYTHTCYAGQHPPCGRCDACRLRQRGFEIAGIPDPLLAV